VATPADPDARRYYRAAFQRLEDAQFMLDIGRRSTAAVYLGGYCIEFLLKALILSHTSGKRRQALAARLRTHSIEGLRRMYAEVSGGVPDVVAQDLSKLRAWDSQLRYEPGTIKIEDAEEFLAAVERVSEWADGRF
jgi:HEPN domain-containing protein